MVVKLLVEGFDMSTSATNLDNQVQTFLQSIPDESIKKVEKCIRRFCPQEQIVFRRFFTDAQKGGKLEKALALVQEQLEKHYGDNADVNGLGYLPSLYADIGVTPCWKMDQ